MMTGIREWLEKYGFGRYTEVFIENDIDLDILSSLTDDDLKELGVSLGDRKRIHAVLERLPHDEADPATPVSSGPEARSPDAEHRQLTVMFCDLVGSTELAQELDPEDLRRVIRACHETWRTAVERYEGFVARYMGDGLLAYFGYPSAHEDDAERAVHAGLEIVEGTRNLGGKDRGGIASLQVRVGIATGSVVAGDLIGDGASRESPVLGETPNLAARLQAAADPDMVAISQATHLLTKGRFLCEAAGEKMLKGIAKPVPVWSVTGRGARDSRFEVRLSAHKTPLAGRQSEVELLLERWQQAKESDTQVVMLCGEAGIGKSRITHVLLDRISTEPHARLRYQCSPYHMNSALHPIVEQLDRTIQNEAESLNLDQLEALASILRKGEQDIEETASLFADLLSIPTGGRYPKLDMLPARRKELTIDAMLRQIAGLARDKPVLFVMEDVHWVDPTTSEVLGRLLNEIHDSRVLILLTFRPEFAVPWPLPANSTTLTLNRLSRRQCVEIINGCAEGKSLPDEILEQIISKTDGVPLFVEELTRTVLESDFLVEESHGYALKSRELPANIPSTLKDSLMARLDRLSRAKEAAQIASVIGREFSHGLLAAVSNIEPQTLDGLLDQLVESGLIFIRRREPDSTYTFKHALVHETAYQSLLKDKRRALHQRILSVIEEKSFGAADNQPDMLAHHATQAGLVERAVEYWRQAGERDAMRSSNVEAIASLSKGLELLAELPENNERDRLELSILTALGPAQMATRGWDAPEVDETYSRARLLARKTGQTTVLFPSIWGLWLVAHAGGRFSQARELLAELLELADDRKDEELLLQACHAGGSHYLGAGKLAKARQYIDKTIALYAESAHRDQALRYGGHDPCVCANSMGALDQFMQGKLATAERYSRSAIQMAGNIGHRPTVAHAYTYRAELSHLRGRPAEARQCAERVLEIAQPYGMNQYAAWATILIGWSRVMTGDAEGALPQVEEGLANLRSLGIRYHLSHRLVLWAEALAAAGRIDEAVLAVDEALTASQETGERWFEPEIVRLKARLLTTFESDARDQAAELLRQAISRAGDMAAGLWQLRAAADLVRLDPEAHDSKTALQSVFDRFVEGFDSPDLSEARKLLGS